MANTYSPMIATLVGKHVISALRVMLNPIIGVFATDLQPTHAEKGSAVTVGINPAVTAAGDLTDDHSGSRATAAADTAQTTVTVTLNQEPCKGFNITDGEAAQIQGDVLPIYIEKRARDCGYSVALSILNYIFELVTAANFSGVAYAGGAAGFNLDKITDIHANLADAGYPCCIPDAIGMLLKPAYVAALRKDKAVQNLSASGVDVVKTGFLGRVGAQKVDIFNVFEAAALPKAGGTPEAEKLVGFVATSDAIALAQRIVEPQSTNRIDDFQVLADEDTGLTLCMRVWYDPDPGKRYYTFESLYGASKANGSALQRIKSE